MSDICSANSGIKKRGCSCSTDNDPDIQQIVGGPMQKLCTVVFAGFAAAGTGDSACKTAGTAIQSNILTMQLPHGAAIIKCSA